MRVDDNELVSFHVGGRQNAFKRHIAFEIKSTGILEIGKGSDAAVEPDLISNGKNR